MVYRVLIVGEGKRFGVSTSSPYLTLAGEFGDSGAVEIPRGDNQVEITVSLLVRDHYWSLCPPPLLLLSPLYIPLLPLSPILPPPTTSPHLTTTSPRSP